MKEFNTTGVCIPSKHYMVDLTDRVREIRKLVDAGKYFTINRARQYGKTTTIEALVNALKEEYCVLSLDFQGISSAGFETEEAFVKTFSRILLRRAKTFLIPEKIAAQLSSFTNEQNRGAILDQLFEVFSDWCAGADKKIVMIIDEIDSASNNQVFLDFLSQLRFQFLERERDEGYGAFWSVILAGVTDVKHLKSQIRDEDQHKVNSPWNIAADFNIDMSLPEDGIRIMLEEYEADHHTGMNTSLIAGKLRECTNGYPFLVSRLCQLMDTEFESGQSDSNQAWSVQGFNNALNRLLEENNTLFQSLTGKLANYPELAASLRSILMGGTKLSYNFYQESIAQMQMYGFIRNDHNTVRISNRIFETFLYNLFLSQEEMNNNVFFKEGDLEKNIFVENGHLNMRLIMEHFIQTFHQIYGPLEERFPEKDGRELFLLYLKPIINGTGNYYIEAQTRDQKRTDVIVDYLGQQYIIELKIWRGERYNAEGERQILNYLDYWNLQTGFMLSFNFNKTKETGVFPVQIGNRILYEGIV